MQHNTEFPGGSKSRVDKAGNNIRNKNFTHEDIEIIETWRAAHRRVLNTFQAILRTRTKNRNISVAQRHKRRSTIYNKLLRFPGMQLSRMDDVAGCRLIFKTIDALYEFRENFHKAEFSHTMKNELDKYDYIKKPKDTGYRGIHDVYTYDVRSVSGKSLKGLYIEIQYRTLIQHAWATSVEIIGLVTESQPKFQSGDGRYITAMAYASEILARYYENKFGPFPKLSTIDVISNFSKLDNELALLKKLSGLHRSKEEISSKKNIILIFSSDGGLKTMSFEYATNALRTLFHLEKAQPESDIVLVRADRSEDTRIAFRNYFSDAKDFIKLITEAIKSLTAKHNGK